MLYEEQTDVQTASVLTYPQHMSAGPCRLAAPRLQQVGLYLLVPHAVAGPAPGRQGLLFCQPHGCSGVPARHGVCCANRVDVVTGLLPCHAQTERGCLHYSGGFHQPPNTTAVRLCHAVVRATAIRQQHLLECISTLYCVYGCCMLCGSEDAVCIACSKCGLFEMLV